MVMKMLLHARQNKYDMRCCRWYSPNNGDLLLTVMSLTVPGFMNKVF
jgi:hypothetical protein